MFGLFVFDNPDNPANGARVSAAATEIHSTVHGNKLSAVSGIRLHDRGSPIPGYDFAACQHLFTFRSFLFLVFASSFSGRLHLLGSSHRETKPARLRHLKTWR